MIFQQDYRCYRYGVPWNKTTSDIGGFIDGDFVGTAPNASFYLFRTEYGPEETQGKKHGG